MNYQITNNWTPLSVLTSIAIGSPMVLSNAGRAGDIIEVIVSDTEPLAADRGVPVKQLDNQYTISGQSQESWVRYIRYDLTGTITPLRTCLLSVQDLAFIQESDALPSDLMTGNTLGSRRLKVSNEPFTLLISKGLVPGHSMVYVNAYANSIGTTEKLIWPLSSQYVISDTPSTFWLTSTNVADANDILVEWLDGDRNRFSSVIALNGQTSVPFAIGVGLRINKIRAINDVAGTLGDVYISREDSHSNGVPTDPDMIVSYFAQNTQTSTLAAYAVPAGYTLFGLTGYFSSPKGKDNDFYWNARNVAAGIPATRTNVVSVYQSTIEIDFAMTPIPQYTDAYFTSKTASGSGSVDSRIVGILVDNNFL